MSQTSRGGYSTGDSSPWQILRGRTLDGWPEGKRVQGLLAELRSFEKTGITRREIWRSLPLPPFSPLWEIWFPMLLHTLPPLLTLFLFLLLFRQPSFLSCHSLTSPSKRPSSSGDTTHPPTPQSASLCLASSSSGRLWMPCRVSLMFLYQHW